MVGRRHVDPTRRALVLESGEGPPPQFAILGAGALRLLADQPRFAGTVGCNRVLGGVEAAGDAVRFRPGPSTMIACPPPIDAQERLSVEVPGTVASWRMDGRTLVLRDGAGRTVAAFEAAYLP